jgi:hypothetical protein
LGLRSRRRRLREECIGLGLGLGEVDLYKLSSQFSAVGSRDERSTMTDERWAGGVFLAVERNGLREDSLSCAMVPSRTTNILSRLSGVHGA